MWVVLRMIRAWKRDWYLIPRPFFWTWIVVGSPVVFVLAFFFYSDLFGNLAT